MQNTPAGHHAAGRNNDARIFGIVDLLRILRRGSKSKTRPLKWRPILADQLARVIAVLLRMLNENLDRLNGHRAVAIHRDLRDLPGLYQLLQYEEELLSALHGKL